MQLISFIELGLLCCMQISITSQNKLVISCMGFSVLRLYQV
ncbi:hypothetical protein BCLUESOX_2658 [bacterium endosymbiont of Bathymodiolus sp. 5 South]|nr:hypothetical protein BCLUESOX_2658 [bacterium endosymbiont of Bathymodiolus sp. 5 South]VVH55455.1 hypothetical protein BSPCLSOX_665 [uncultured Gammaproteobacteria bacterium]VVH57647.1 hypothetical protein BSPCLSOX_999 [uncultured Gammaproteobacteria bacterium]